MTQTHPEPPSEAQDAPRSRRKVRPNGYCTICRHTERVSLEMLLAGGATVRSVGEKFGIGYRSVHRHWRYHVSEARKARLVLGPVRQAALAARVADEAESVMDHYRTVRAGLYEQWNAALEAGDRNTGARLANCLLRCLDAMARVTGELATSPLVQINNQQTAVFVNDPQFHRFIADLVRALAPYPDARNAVLLEFQRIEQSAAASDLTALNTTALLHEEASETPERSALVAA